MIAVGRSFALLAIVSAIAKIAVPSVKAQSFLTNGLVAYYPFNGNANDASGNGYNCTNVSVTFVPDRFGNPSASALFNGSSSYLKTPSALAQLVSGTGPLTVSVWMKIDPAYTNSGNKTMVEFGAPSNNQAFILGMIGGQFIFSEWGSSYNLNSGTPIGDNLWHQGVCTFDGTNVSAYVDGVSRGTEAAPSNRSPLAGMIGARFDLCCEFWNGGIDDVRVYSRALSASEVQQLYQFESPCTPRRATATAEVVNGFVVGATITDGGCGYTNAPAVAIEGGGGSGAVATAVVSNGVVVGITVLDAGSGYTNTPTVYIYSPLGLQIGLAKAVQPFFSDLLIGTNYQLQVSGDLNTWTNTGSPFPATNRIMAYPQFFNVDDWSQLFFRLQVSP